MEKLPMSESEDIIKSIVNLTGIKKYRLEFSKYYRNYYAWFYDCVAIQYFEEYEGQSNVLLILVDRSKLNTKKEDPFWAEIINVADPDAFDPMVIAMYIHFILSSIFNIEEI